MPAKRDKVRLIIEIAVYVILGWVAMSVAGWLTVGLGGYLVGVTVAVFSAAIFVFEADDAGNARLARQNRSARS